MNFEYYYKRLTTMSNSTRRESKKDECFFELLSIYYDYYYLLMELFLLYNWLSFDERRMFIVYNFIVTKKGNWGMSKY